LDLQNMAAFPIPTPTSKAHSPTFCPMALTTCHNPSWKDAYTPPTFGSNISAMR
jgi:hypothetical protein